MRKGVLIMLPKALFDEVLFLAHEVKKNDKLYVRRHMPNCMKVDLSVLDEKLEVYEEQRFAESLRGLYSYLSSLNTETLKDLVTILFLGRGAQKDEKNGEFSYAHIRELAEEECRQTDKKLIVSILVENLLLCDYLETGYEIVEKYEKNKEKK